MFKKICLLIIVCSSCVSYARTSALQDLMLSFGMIQDPHIQICPEETPIDYESSDSSLWLQAQGAAGLYNKCKAAEYYRSLIIAHPNSAYFKDAYRSYIEVFLTAQDFVMAMNKGNEYLEKNLNKNLNKNDSEYIHLLVLRAVQGEIRQRANRAEQQNEFVAYSLGFNTEQNEKAPFLLNLKYRSFLDKFPNSIHTDEVVGMMNESRQLYGQKILADAREALLRDNYTEAFRKYDVILKWGPVVDVFAEALFEMTEYHFNLAWIISDKNLLSDYKLNQLLGHDASTVITATERASLSTQTKAKGMIYLSQMTSKLPSSKWTQQAKVSCAQMKFCN